MKETKGGESDARATRSLVQRFRTKVRDYEDRKISAGDMARATYHVAHQLHGDEELRRSLERLANRINVLSEEGLTSNVHSRVLEVVDEIMSQLVEAGY